MEQCSSPERTSVAFTSQEISNSIYRGEEVIEMATNKAEAAALQSLPCGLCGGTDGGHEPGCLYNTGGISDSLAKESAARMEALAKYLRGLGCPVEVENIAREDR